MVAKERNRVGIEITISSDETFKSTFLKVPGCVQYLLKSFILAQKKESLDYFLNIHNLDRKKDMPIKKKDKNKTSITTETIENVHKIAKYALSCITMPGGKYVTF